MIRTAAIILASLGYVAASGKGYVPNLMGLAVQKAEAVGYKNADDETRRNFLIKETEIELKHAKRLIRGTGYSITDYKVDTVRNRVTLIYRYPRDLHVTKASIRASAPDIYEISCKPWSQSNLGRWNVSLRFAYHNVRNQEVGSVLINPGTCHGYI